MATVVGQESIPFSDLPPEERARIVDELLAPAVERGRRYEEWRQSPAGQRLAGEEAGRRGREQYDGVVRPALTAADDGKFVVIDLETGAYELDRSEGPATDRLTARVPAFSVWVGRVGYAAVVRPGLGWVRA